MLVIPNFFLPLLLFALPSLADEGILDCLTGPCVTVPGVGKLQGTWQNTQWTDRRVYQFMGIPFGETTGGEHRFVLFCFCYQVLLSYFVQPYIWQVWSTAQKGAFERWQRRLRRVLLQLHHRLVGPCVPSGWDFAWRRVCQPTSRPGSSRSRVERHHAR